MDEFSEPTTSTRSDSAATAFTACCRFVRRVADVVADGRPGSAGNRFRSASTTSAVSSTESVVCVRYATLLPIVDLEPLRQVVERLHET